MEPGELDPHLHAKGGVEVGERLVEQEDLGVADDGAPDGHALPLPARELLRLAVQQRLELKDACGVVHLLLPLLLGNVAELEAEPHVVRHAHVRIERVALEHHGEAALGRRDVVRPDAVDEEVAAGDLLQPGDESQQGGLAAAGRAHEDAELAVLDPERHALDDVDVSEGLLDVGELDGSHCALSSLLHGAKSQATHQLPLAHPAEDEDGRDGHGRRCGELGPEEPFRAGK